MNISALGLNPTIGICIPSACSSGDIQKIMNKCKTLFADTIY